MKVKTTVKAGASAQAWWDWIVGKIKGEPTFTYPSDSAVA
jgi:hypothetical protein